MSMRWSVVSLVSVLSLSACQRQADSSLTGDDDFKALVSAADVTRSAMTLIPAGEFIMGSDKGDKDKLQEQYGFVKPLYLDEHPQHSVNLPAFYIDTYEVTNAQYKAWVMSTKGVEPFDWSQNGYNLVPARLRASDVNTLRWIATDYFKLDMDTRQMDKAALLKAMFDDQAQKNTLPVTGVTWPEADAYCRWAGKRLPTEQEWEKAARGAQGLEFPWGNDWKPDITNTGDNSDQESGIVPVGSFPANRSPYGVFDMSGNVWEWVADWYQPYPGNKEPSKEYGQQKKVIRGGGGGVGHYSIPVFFRGATRQYAEPTARSEDVGFRCAKDG